MRRAAFLAAILLSSGMAAAQQPPPNPRPPKPPASNDSQQDRCERERSGLDIRIYAARGQLEPAAELLLSDPQGRKVGMDPGVRKSYAEIPNAGYEFEGIDDDETGEPGPQTGVIWVLCGPLTGEYHLAVVGTKEGTYEIEALAFDDEYRSSSRRAGPTAVKAGARHEYKIVLNLRPKAMLSLSRVAPVAKK